MAIKSWKLARASAAARSKRLGRLFVARKVRGGYAVGPVSPRRPTRRAKAALRPALSRKRRLIRKRRAPISPAAPAGLAALANPPGEIGRSVTLHGRRSWHYPISRISRGSHEREAVLVAIGKAPPIGSRFSRVDYDNPAKALRAYGRVDRFRHDRERAPLTLSRVAKSGRGFRALLTAKVPVWRKD